MRNTLPRYIDHTKLTFAPGEDEAAAIRQLCREAQDCGFYAVCVRPRHGAMAKVLLQDTPVKVATVIGFPAEKVPLADEQRQPTVGNVSTEDKLAEVRQALADGVDELDVVLNVALFKAHPAQALVEIQSLVQAAAGQPVKVIVETDLLLPEEIQAATRLCVDAGAAMVKTSTGMLAGGVGATVETIRLIQQTLAALGASPVGIKASGGIRTAEQAQALVAAGATRLGTSAGVGMVGGCYSETV